MVGVPKRTRGCEACKKRRLTCNYDRPKCHRCKNDGRECHYPNAFTFVVNYPGSHRTTYRKRSPHHRVACTSDEEIPRNYTLSDTVSEVRKKPATTRETCSTRPAISLDPSIPQRVSALGAMQQQLQSYALCRFSTHPPADISLIETWTPTLQQFAGSTKPLKASSLACCAAWIARSDSNPSMSDFSRRLYSQGLCEVRTVLQSPGANLDDELLGACLALAAFEVFECPAQCRAAYQWHRRAFVNLVLMRGARMHQEGLGHELFLAVRVHGILYAYEERKPNFLCTREWSTVPWQIKPKDDLHQLADILAKGPQLLHEANGILTKPLEQSLPTLFTILSRLLDIDADLECFYRSLVAKAMCPLFWEVTASGCLLENDLEPNASSQFKFIDHRTASLLTLYWSIASMVWSALETIHASLADTNTLHILLNSSRTSRFSTLAPDHYWLCMVRNILRSVDYCMTATAGSASPPGIGVALEIIIDIMKPKTNCEAELQKAVDARDEMGRRWAAILLS